MIDLDDIRERPWVLTDWQTYLGLSVLVSGSVVDALAKSQVAWPELDEASLPIFKASERRVLLTFTPPEQLASMFKRFEAALHFGNVVEFGQKLAASPHRFDATIVSLLSSRAKVS